MEEAPASIVLSDNDIVPAQQHQLPPVNGGGDDSGSIGGGVTDDVDRNSGGNRWPKQETLALIRIRSEMDSAFRDSNLKGPLWDEVSRKLSELGFHRSGKKCREKFENVYKYHRRTKDGRSLKSDKIYRFSDQLQALESNHRGAFMAPPPVTVKPPPVYVAMSDNASIPSPYNGGGPDQIQNNVSPISVAAPAVVAMPPPPVVNQKRMFPFSQPNMSGSTDSATSSEDTSDDEPPRKKKKKWEDFFEKLMKELVEKQEEMQMKFLETLDRRERDRVAKEEAWRAQEIAKMNQEHDRLVKERSIVAAKDAAIVTFLQKLVGKNFDSVPMIIDDEARKKLKEVPENQTPPPPQPIQQTPPPQVQQSSLPSQCEAPPLVVPPLVVKKHDGGTGSGENNNNMLSPSPSRWPKAEINALITLRTQLDIKYQENVPKGPLWEEISAAMRTLGYNRNAKRCKEKWENINKYYKKIKESNKKRPDDSKTCPYFDQLDAIYRERSTPIVAQPEQQWPPANVVMVGGPHPPQPQQDNRRHVSMGQETETPREPQPSTAEMEDEGSEEYDDFEDEDEDDDDDGGGDDEDDKKDEHGVYEIVPSKVSSIATV